MTHIAKEQMQAYVLNTLDDEVREYIEEHLYYCDECLAQYTEAIEAHEHHLPDLPEDMPLAAHVIEAVRSEASETVETVGLAPSTTKAATTSTTTTSRSMFTRSIAHYAIAATVTLMLMSTGVFQSLTGLASTVDEVNKQEGKGSFSEHIMERTLQWFDFNDRQEGENQ